MNSQKAKGSGLPRRPAAAGNAANAPKTGNKKPTILEDTDIDKIITSFFSTADNKWTPKNLANLSRSELATVLEQLTANLPVADLQDCLKLRGCYNPLDSFSKLYSSKVPKNQKKPNIAIDTTSSSLRKALLNLLPESYADLATVGTVQFPTENKLAVKKLLRYFGAFSLLTEGVWKDIDATAFTEALELALEKRRQEEEAVNTYIQLQEEINTHIMQADEWEQQLELLRREFSRDAEKYHLLRQNHVQEEQSLAAEQKDYQEKERDLQRLRNQIAEVNEKAAALRKGIIHNLSEIRLEMGETETRIAALQADREKIHAETAALEKKGEKLSTLGETIGKFTTWVTDMVELIHEICELDEKHDLENEELQLLKQEKKQIQADLVEASQQDCKEQLKANAMRKELEARIVELENEISVLEEKTSRIMVEMEGKMLEIQRYEAIIAENLAQSDEYQEQFLDDIQYLKHDLPCRRNLINLAMRRITQAYTAYIARFQPPPAL